LYDRLQKFLLDPARTFQTAEKTAAKYADRVALRVQLRNKEQASIDGYFATFPANIKDAKQ